MYWPQRNKVAEFSSVISLVSLNITSHSSFHTWIMFIGPFIWHIISQFLGNCLPIIAASKEIKWVRKYDSSCYDIDHCQKRNISTAVEEWSAAIACTLYKYLLVSELWQCLELVMIFAESSILVVNVLNDKNLFLRRWFIRFQFRSNELN